MTRRGVRRLALGAAVRRLWFAAAAGIAAACGKDAAPLPGELAVRHTAQQPARAMVLTITGPEVATPGDAASAYQIAAVQLSPTSWRVLVVAPQGTTLQDGQVVRFSVPDVNAAGSYSATVVQVAGAGYALQNPSQYSLSIVRP
jgi:hypothetical protein